MAHYTQTDETDKAMGGFLSYPIEDALTLKGPDCNDGLSRRLARLVIAVLVAVSSLLFGCSSQEQDVRAVCAQAIESLRAGEALAADEFYLLPDERLFEMKYAHEPLYKICVAALSEVSYELGEVRIDGDKAQVDISVKAPNLYEALARAQEDVSAYVKTAAGTEAMAVREDINQRMRYMCDWLLVYLEEHLNDRDIELLTFSVTAHLSRAENGAWVLDFSENPDLLKALFCVDETD